MAGGSIRYDQLLTNYDSRKRDAAESDPWHHAGRAKPLGRQYAAGTCQHRLTEEARYYEGYSDEDALVDAPVFPAHRPRQARSAADPEAALRSERDRRDGVGLGMGGLAVLMLISGVITTTRRDSDSGM